MADNNTLTRLTTCICFEGLSIAGARAIIASTTEKVGVIEDDIGLSSIVSSGCRDVAAFSATKGWDSSYAGRKIDTHSGTCRKSNATWANIQIAGSRVRIRKGWCDIPE